MGRKNSCLLLVVIVAAADVEFDIGREAWKKEKKELTPAISPDQTIAPQSSCGELRKTKMLPLLSHDRVPHFSIAVSGGANIFPQPWEGSGSQLRLGDK